MARSQSMARLRRRILLVTGVALVALAVGPAVAALQQGRDDRPGQVASVDFVVVTREGQPVTDLKASELTLRVGNKNRPIRTLQYIRMAADMAGAVSTRVTPLDPLPPAFTTNMVTVGDLPRMIVLVVDDESMPIGQEEKLRIALRNFVRDLPPKDNVALVTVPHGGLMVGFTTDRELLRKEIANISPITPMQPAICRTRATLQTLENTVGILARTSQQPVIVGFMSASLMGMSRMEQAPQPNRGSLSPQGGVCYLTGDDFARVGAALAAHRAQLYILNPDFSQDPVLEGIENLRGQTGAPLFHLQSSGEPGLSRMARETSGYYVVTFDTDPEERNGKAQPATIRTTRRDVEVRSRPYVVVGRPSGLPASATTVTTAFDMVRNGRQYRDLPLRATTASFRNADGRVNVAGWFEPMDPSIKIMTAAAALIDENGRGVAFWQGEAEQMTKWPAAVSLPVPPGTYRLRIAAIDSNGRLGLVDDRMVAEIRRAGPLQVSDLMLGVSPGGGFAARLEFTNEESATAFLELYGASEGAAVGAVFEVARTENGPAVQTIKGAFAPTPEDGKFAVTATIPLSGLAPGSYVVRAIVGAAGQPAVRVIRTLVKSR